MKCTKCNFVSFDYLSECKKCGTSLSGTRDGLGLSPVKPVIPFFLGSLLKDYDESMQAGAPAAQEAEISLPSLDIGEIEPNFAEDEPASLFGPRPEPAAESPAPDDLNLLEISDDELDLLMEDSHAGAASTVQSTDEIIGGLDIELEPHVASTRIRPLEPAMEAAPEPSLSGLVMESEPAAELAAEPIPAAAPEPAAATADLDAEESLQIDLSENDLEALLTELESSSGKPKKPGSAS